MSEKVEFAPKILENFREAVVEYLNRLAHYIETHGLCDMRTETVFDMTPDMFDDKIDWPKNDDLWVSALDEAFDGYLVKPRTPFKNVRDAWAIQYTFRDIYVTWIDSRGWTSTTYDDRLVMDSPNPDTSGHCVASLHKYGVWPIREGFLPPPLKSQMVDNPDE